MRFYLLVTHSINSAFSAYTKNVYLAFTRKGFLVHIFYIPHRYNFSLNNILYSLLHHAMRNVDCVWVSIVRTRSRDIFYLEHERKTKHVLCPKTNERRWWCGGGRETKRRRSKRFLNHANVTINVCLMWICALEFFLRHKASAACSFVYSSTWWQRKHKLFKEN